MATTTAGFHRISNVTARAAYSTTQMVVPGATIYVTLTSSGTQATIYSDPGLSIAIPGARITADPSGWYDYYIPLNYNVTETISAVSGQLVVIPNIVQNAGSSTLTPVANEVVAGSGTSFTLAHTPAAGSLSLYNGSARLWPGSAPKDYTISGVNITMNYSLSMGDLLADYWY